MGSENIEIQAVFVEPDIQLNSIKLTVQKGKTNKNITFLLKNDKIKTAISSNTKIATVTVKGGNKLWITGKKVGKTKIKIVTQSNLIKNISVIVQKGKVVPKSIKVSKKALKIKKGATEYINCNSNTG